MGDYLGGSVHHIMSFTASKSAMSSETLVDYLNTFDPQERDIESVPCRTSAREAFQEDDVHTVQALLDGFYHSARLTSLATTCTKISITMCMRLLHVLMAIPSRLPLRHLPTTWGCFHGKISINMYNVSHICIMFVHSSVLRDMASLHSYKVQQNITWRRWMSRNTL